MKIAFYKGTVKGYKGLFSLAIRWWEGGPYSHTEVIFSDGMSASSSFLDGGVRFKYIEYNPERWDIFEITDAVATEREVRQWYEAREERRYDYMGVLSFIVKFLTPDPMKHFCSETQAASIWKMKNPKTIGPNALARMKGFLK